MPYRSLFNVEPHALRERKLHPEIDRVGGPTHIGLPHVGIGQYTDWTPLSDRGRLFPESVDLDDPWQFSNVLVT